MYHHCKTLNKVHGIFACLLFICTSIHAQVPTNLINSIATGSLVATPLTQTQVGGVNKFLTCRLQAGSAQTSGVSQFWFSANNSTALPSVSNTSGIWDVSAGNTKTTAFAGTGIISPSATNASAFYIASGTLGGSQSNTAATIAGYYYTFNFYDTTVATSSNMAILQTTGLPRVINSVAQGSGTQGTLSSPGTGVGTGAVQITITLNSATNVGDYVYLRYSTNGFANAGSSNPLIVAALENNGTGYSGTTYHAIIPGQSSGTTVSYYAFTSSFASLAGTTDKTVLPAVLNLKDNSGSYYAYTTNSSNDNQVSVTATAGVTGPTAYSSLGQAFTAINAGTHQGAITMSINGNTIEPSTSVPLLSGKGGSGHGTYSSILIKPGSNTAYTISGIVTATALIELEGADNVTIDGDPNNTGTKFLTFQQYNYSSSNANAVIRLGSVANDGACYNTVKNCNILGSRYNDQSNSSTYGIVIAEYTANINTSVNLAGDTNNTIYNNNLTRSLYGIYAVGSSGAGLQNPGLIIKKNTIGSSAAGLTVGSLGIFVSYTDISGSFPTANNGLIDSNDIRLGDIAGATGFSTTGGDITGINVSLGNTGLVVSNNTIHDIVEPNTVQPITGIYVTSSGTFPSPGIKIFNNFIRDIKMNSGSSTFPNTISASSPNFMPFGIHVVSCYGAMNIDNNTIILNNNGYGSQTNPTSACIGLPTVVNSGSAAYSFQIRNNILVNNQSSTNALGILTYTNLSSVVAGSFNYNDYYIPSGNIGGIYSGGISTYSSVAAWSANANGVDANSLTIQPTFTTTGLVDINPTTTSNWPLFGSGIAKATTGVTTDIYRTTRGTNPCIGADEFALPTATLSGTATICNGLSTNLTITYSGTGSISGKLSDSTAFSSSTVTVSPTATTTYRIAYLKVGTASLPSAQVSGAIIVTVKANSTTTITTSICSGSSYASHSSTGVYTDHYTSANGCDSARTLNLTVLPNSTSTVTTSICSGSSYTGHSSTGVYTDHYTSANGCDSVRTLNLTVLPNSTSTVTTTICSGSTYAGHSSTNVYTDHYISANGCDSARTLNLTVLPNSTSTVTTSLCAGSNYAGHTTTGVYTDHYTSANGCDSARTLNLTVNPNISDTVVLSICNGTSYAGYSAAGIYVDHFTSAAGCDSARTLILSITPRPTANITGSSSVCAGTSETYSVAFSGSGPWIYIIDTAGGTLSGSNATGSITFTIRPGASKTVKVTSLSDAHCTAQYADLDSQIVTLTNNCAIVWTGAIDTSWHNAANWNGGIVPNSCSVDVNIPAGTPRSPVISTRDIQIGNITIGNAQKIKLNGHNLSICKNFAGPTSSANAYNIYGSGKLVFNGSVAQTYTGYGNVDEMTLNNGSGLSLLNQSYAHLSLYRGLNLQSGTITNSPSGAVILLSNSADTVAWLNDFGTSYTGAFSGNLTVQRKIPATGTTWQHQVSAPVHGSGVTFYSLNQSTYGWHAAAPLIPSMGCSDDSIHWTSPYSTALSWHENNVNIPVAGQLPVCATRGWYTVGGPDQFGIGTGYSIYLTSGSKLSLTGAVNTGNINVSGLTNSNWSVTSPEGHLYNSGWSLVGNPYPSALNMSANRLGNGFDNQIQLYIPSGPFAGTYQAGILGNSGAPVKLAAFQGFMVRKSVAGGTSSWPFLQSERTTNQGSAYHMYKTSAANQLVINVSGNGFNDVTKLQFLDVATDGFDPEFDAHKFASRSGQPTLYTLAYGSNAWMSINAFSALDKSTIIPMGFEAGADGSYTVSVSADDIASFDTNTNIFMEDKQNPSNWINLRNTAAYTFSARAMDSRDRFVLHFEKTITGINEVASSSDLNIFGVENRVLVDFSKLKNVDATIQIFNVIGQELSNEKYHSADTYSKIISNVEAAYVIVKVKMADGSMSSKKLFISK